MSNIIAHSAIDLEKVIEHEEDIAALARMIMFAQNSAEDLRLESTVYCLKMAMQALYQQVRADAIDPLAAPAKRNLTPARH